MRYTIDLILNITNAKLNASNNKTVNDLRKNKLGTKAVLKFSENNSLAKSEFKDLQWYTHKEILEVLLTAEWDLS